MRLKKIELLGFKSFADKTVLSFNEPLTAIVGPNGCGKSNIVDAFRWVMGEQSAKSMRGDKMADIIFSGSDKRKPINYAEVSLVFTDAKDFLDIEYDEVAITRKLFRSGESEWYLNKNPVRLKDIHSLFWDTGLGKDAFCIFEQNKMDQLIHSSPMERRYIFEEAAKVTRFKERKKEALKKLSLVEQNLSRVEDIHLEVEKQIETLNQQAEEAKIFKENQHQLEALEKALLAFKWQKFSEDKETKKSQAKQLKEQIFQDTHKLERLQNQLTHQKAKLRELDISLQTASEALYQAKSNQKIKLSEKDTYTSLLEKSSKRFNEISSSLKILETKEQEDRQNYENNQRDLSDLEQKRQELEEKLQQLIQSQQKLESRVEETRHAHKEARESYLKALQNENQSSEQLQKLQTKVTHIQNSIAALEEKQQRFLEKKQISQEKQTSSEKDLQLLQNKCQELADTELELENTLCEFKNDYDAQTSTLNELKEEISEIKGKIATLRQMQAELEGCSQSTKKLLQASQDANSPIFQYLMPLMEVMEIQEGKENAYAMTLLAYQETLFVKTKAEFQAVIKFAETHQLSSFSLFCLEFSSITSSDSISKLITKHFVSETQFLNIPLNTSQTQPKTCGTNYFIDDKQVLFFKPSIQANPFLRSKEIEKYENMLVNLQAQYDSILHLKTKLQENIQHTQQRLKETQKELKQSEMRLVQVKYAFESAKKDLLHFEMEYTQTIEIQKQQDLELDSQQKSLKETEANYQSFHNQTEALQNTYTHIDSRMESLFNQLHQSQQNRKTCEEQLQKLRQTIHSLKQAIHTYEIQKETYSAQRQHLQENQQSLQEEIQDNTEKKQCLEEALALCLEDLQEKEALFTSLKEKVDSLKEAMLTDDTAIAELRNNIETGKDQINQLNLKINEIDTNFNFIKEELHTRYHIDQNSIPEIDSSLVQSLSSAEKQLKILRKYLEDHPDINLLAITECEKYLSRREFLEDQIADLNQSKTELVEIITKLDTESRKLFKQTFETIRNNFRQNFNLLFEGGMADLELLNEGDILEAGIDIIAKPPGKNMRSIHLLSGGEKCLTAIALLFALFEIQPVPFCILDEIDAPLDDTNISRFTKVLKQFMKNNQFIIITHNKCTMAVADALLGVSMQERGVSRVLPLKFETQEQVKSSELAQV